MGKAETNKQKKRESLLNTAFDLFTTKGINNTSIADIVEAAGVAKGTFYLYFKDKYDINSKLLVHKATLLFESALELGEHTNGICEIIELIDGMDDAYEYMPDVSNDYDLGYYWIEESGCYDTSALGNLSRYIDYEAFGRDIYLESNCCCYTSRGYIQLIDDCWCPFDVDDIPEEYRL